MPNAAPVLCVLIAASACTARAEPEPSGTTSHATAVSAAERDARSRFLRDMIVHHRQALDMAAFVPERTESGDVRRLAQRIEVAQTDEIARMAHWLEAHGEQVPDAHAQHGAHADMPGMLSADQLSALAAARGRAFDLRFLESMIRHHEGALVMVRELMGTAAGRSDIEVFLLASQIDADQRAEIRRMQQLLEQLGAE